jgi:hypothetical protein
MKSRLFFIFYSLILASVLVACGGGGSSSNTSATPTNVTLGGKVIDGYVKGATVCLDLNSNNQCDANEPTTTSAADGSYSLTYSGNISGLQVVSVVPVGAVDSDLGVVTTQYNLLAPVPTDPNTYKNTHVTPLTTLVASNINQAGGQSALTPALAESQVKANLSLPNDANLLNNDYKASSTTTNTSLAKVSTYVATAVAQVSNNLSSNTLVAAQLTSGQITQAAVQQVQNSILPTVMSNGALSNSAKTAVESALSGNKTALESNLSSTLTSAGLSSDQIKASTSGGTISGNVLDIVNGTKNSGSSNSVTDLAALMKSTGLVFVGLSNYVHFINSSGTVSCLSNSNSIISYLTSFGANNNDCSGNTALEAEFVQFDLQTPSNNIDVYFHLIGDKWYTKYETGAELTYDGTSWVPRSNSFVPTFSNNCINIPVNSKVSEQACGVVVDVSGQLMTKYIPNLCDKSPTNTPLASCSTAKFPDGSNGYNLTLSIQSNITDSTYNGIFNLGVNKTWSGYCAKNNCATGTLSDFINYTLSNIQFKGANCNTPFMIASYDATQKTGVINFASNTSGKCNFSYTTKNFPTVEVQNFSVISKGGKDVMVFPTPATYKANNPGNNEPYQIFAQGCIGDSKTNCGIYSGSYLPVNFKQSVPFNGNLWSNTQIVNPTLFNAVMSIQGNTAFPYKNKGSSGVSATSGTSAPN